MMSTKIKIPLYRYINQIPSCLDCVHIEKYKVYDPYYYPSKNVHLAKCKKFAFKNQFTNEMDFEYAIKCRNNQKLCGEKAIYFIEK